MRGQENFSSSLSYHAGAAISTGLKVLAYHGTEGSRSLWVLVQSFSSFDLLILLTGRIVVENRVVTPPAANLEFDQLTMSENKKTDKPFLLQSLQSGQGLAAEACAEIPGQFFHRHDPFAGVDGVTDAINALV